MGFGKEQGVYCHRDGYDCQGFLLGMVVGLAMGGTLGVCLAPTPREKRKLKKETKAQVYDLLEQLKDSLQGD